MIGWTWCRKPTLIGQRRCRRNCDRKALILLGNTYIIRLANASGDKAFDAFLITKLHIDAMLERLKALSDDHFETNPDEINWGGGGLGAGCCFGM